MFTVRKALAFAVFVCGLLAACRSRPEESQHVNAATKASSSDASSDATMAPVTAAAGPSWLHRMGLSLSQTRMGKLGGMQSPPAAQEPATENGRDVSFALTGADLYRLNCQSCHGPKGEGSPPEINSVIGPVQGASEAMVLKRMKARGTEISDEMAGEMAAEARKDLLDRLRNGGKEMPAFNYLRPDEIETLFAYLDHLAGTPEGKRSLKQVNEPAARVGEQLVKGTCQICHDATGPGGGRMGMMRGIIPSLASLPEEHSLNSAIRQVRNGSSGMMSMMGGPKMPPFPYLTNSEIEAGFLYLERYPPRP